MLSAHAYMHGVHCRACKATYARQWRARTGGKSGARQREMQRMAWQARVAVEPHRFGQARGLWADFQTGEVYGARRWPLGSLSADGYILIDGGCTEDGRLVGAHRVVWEAAYGPINPGLEVNHLNGNKTDNRLVNLEAVTRSANLRHAYGNGFASNKGERHPGHKLTEADVIAIRQEDPKVPSRVIAEQYGVSSRCVRDVINYKTWIHVGEGSTA